MKRSLYVKIITVVSLAGFAFSGYLSAVKLFTATCALREPCPYFLGYPACWYGFGLFLTLTVLALTALAGRLNVRKTAVAQLVVGLTGVVFAGYFTVPEIARLLSGGSFYALGLPTCAYGLIFYLLISVLAIVYLRSPQEGGDV
jgi:uncharacterized membrane protein